MTLELLHARWHDLSFREFSQIAQQIGGISSDKVNNILLRQLQDRTVTTTNTNSGGESSIVSWLLLIVALHFQLGKRAEFTLNDHTYSALLGVLEKNSGKGLPHLSQMISDLSVMLLSLNTTTAASTIGIENQLCALYLVAPQDHQRLLLPLVHRSFYSSLRSTSLSAEAFNTVIRRHALDPSFHEFLRLFALVNSKASVLEEFITGQLLATSPVGQKPMFGSAPVALSLCGSKCNNGSSLQCAFFSVLHHLEQPTPAQIHHCYLVSSFAAAFRLHTRRNAPLHLTLDACSTLATYLIDIFSQLVEFMNGKKVTLFCTKKAVGLQFIEAVVSEALFVAKKICVMHRESSVAADLIAEVTNFLYCAMKTVRIVEGTKLQAGEVPEIGDGDNVIQFSCRSSNSSKDKSTPSQASPNADASTAVPLFSPDVMIKCLEFQIDVAPLEETLNFFGDIFNGGIWTSYLARNDTFALELCMALLRNAKALSTVLPTLAPRVMWLLSQQPHILFPVVKRLIVPMMSEATSLDIFFRIVFLPLICFSNNFAPPDAPESCGLEGVDGESGAVSAPAVAESVLREHEFYRELWDAIMDWEVNETYQSTALAELCLLQGKQFQLWDALHRSMGTFDGTMIIAYRLIRPLLTEYFKSAQLPIHIFSAIRTAFFFMVSPQEQRHIVTDFLLEMGRWVAEARPELVTRATPCLVELIQQEFVPNAKRSWQLQRWAAMVSATALSLRNDSEIAVREAAVYFEVIHVVIWELVALASTVVTIQHQSTLTPTGSTERDVVFQSYQRCPLKAFQFADTTFATSTMDYLSNNSSLPTDAALAADFLPEAQLSSSHTVTWSEAHPVWVAPSTTTSKDMCGVAFTEHMHSLVIALAMLSKVCPNVKERGIICLANLIRTLTKSRHAGTSLLTTATVCLKVLKYPTMNGIHTMPLHALLGLQVIRGEDVIAS